MATYGLYAAAAAIIVVTVWITAADYGSLPDRVPTQFWFDGKPTSFGPRPLIWVTVAVQLLTAAIFAFTQRALSSAPATHRHVVGMDLAGLCILALLAHAQTMIIEAAKSLPDQRLPLPRYWISIVGFLAAAVICGVLF